LWGINGAKEMSNSRVKTFMEVHGPSKKGNECFMILKESYKVFTKLLMTCPFTAMKKDLARG